MWCRHFTQHVPECPISAHFLAIYVLHFFFQLHQQEHKLIYFNKIPIHVGIKVVVHYCSSPVAVAVVYVVFVIVFVVLLLLFWWQWWW
jgi:hypothetical protein